MFKWIKRKFFTKNYCINCAYYQYNTSSYYNYGRHLCTKKAKYDKYDDSTSVKIEPCREPIKYYPTCKKVRGYWSRCRKFKVKEEK